jgi:phospholipid/cholesterol/gamma-HCH transport system substrate-binding protein
MASSSRLRLSRRIWTQLAILASVTILSIGVMAFGFVRVPALLGIGRYTVKVDLPASGGLYPTSVVTYRGSEIGIPEFRPFFR